MIDLEKLRIWDDPGETICAEAAAEIARLHNLLRMPLSGTEMKLVDKHCDWIAFKHAWNAVIKHRLSAINAGEEP